MAATILILAAALNAALLALALGYRAFSKRAPSGLYAAVFLLCAALAVALITLDHSGLALDSRALAFGEGVLTLATGPLLVLFVVRLLGKQISPFGRLVLFAPVTLYLFAAAVWPLWAMRAFVVERLVLVQMAFTAYAAARVIVSAPTGARAVRARALAFASLAPMAVLHIAQVVRMSWPDAEAVRDIVPFVGAAAFLALTAAVYFGGRLSALDPLTDAPPPLTDEARVLAQAFDKALAGALLRDPQLSVARAAAILGVAPDVLTRALRAVQDRSFPEYIQMRRVEAAQRLLLDPKEARTSMEAIGMLVGFGSRSAFYKAFHERVGMSPATFRQSYASNAVQNPEIGQ